MQSEGFVDMSRAGCESKEGVITERVLRGV